ARSSSARTRPGALLAAAARVPTALPGASDQTTSEGALRHPDVRPPQWVPSAPCDPTTRGGALALWVGVLGFSAAEVWTTDCDFFSSSRC
ncbi:mCG145127, partial [Mus musculus]